MWWLCFVFATTGGHYITARILTPMYNSSASQKNKLAGQMNDIKVASLDKPKIYLKSLSLKYRELYSGVISF